MGRLRKLLDKLLRRHELDEERTVALSVVREDDWPRVVEPGVPAEEQDRRVYPLPPRPAHNGHELLDELDRHDPYNR